jgi:hypothetical protein
MTRRLWKGSKNRSSIVLACMLVIVATGFSASLARQSGQVPAEQYRGYYAWGPERSAFVPCADSLSSERWWVVLADSQLEVRDSLADAAPEADANDAASAVWYAAVNGVLSGRDTTGHLGAYNRVLNVKQIRGLRRASSSDCGGVSRALRVITSW